MRSSKRPLAALALSLIWLTACANGASEVSSCPPAPEYSADFNKRLADEVEAMPADSATVRALSDYATILDQLRVSN